MELSPLTPPNRQLIQTYGNGGFRISGGAYATPVLVFPNETLTWAGAVVADLTPDNFAPVTAAEPAIEILILGCGPRTELVPAGLRDLLRECRIVLEAMDTGGACRTYNVLVAEDRRVAAALLPVD